MKIRHLAIERFRGIRSLDWRPQRDFVCLLGPGDSTKTTILDAIELALSPRWNLTLGDNDFYETQTNAPILIQLTVGDLPKALTSDAKHGLEARGWCEPAGIRDEPEDGDELVLTIELRVDASHEQRWSVVNDRKPEGKHITARDREKIGCTRAGAYVQRDLSWVSLVLTTRPPSGETRG